MTDIIIETDWNNVDASGIVRHVGQGLPRVWARDGDEEAPVLGFLVDFSKTRAAQYAERPIDDSLDAAEQAWFDGYQAGRANEVDDWNRPDEYVRDGARAYVRALAAKLGEGEG